MLCIILLLYIWLILAVFVFVGNELTTGLAYIFGHKDCMGNLVLATIVRNGGVISKITEVRKTVVLMDTF